MTDARWQEFFDVMTKEGVYPATLPLRDAYTLAVRQQGLRFEQPARFGAMSAGFPPPRPSARRAPHAREEKRSA